MEGGILYMQQEPNFIRNIHIEMKSKICQNVKNGDIASSESVLCFSACSTEDIFFLIYKHLFWKETKERKGKKKTALKELIDFSDVF